MGRFTAEMSFAPFDLTDVDELAKPVAEVIRDEIRAAILALPVNPTTKRRPFVDSGNFVNNLRVEQLSDGAWAVLPPYSDMTETQLERLVELVPLLRDPLSSPRVQAAIAAALKHAAGR